MLRKLLAALGVALTISMCLPGGAVNAEEQMFNIVGEYTADNNETPNEAKRQALKDAIRQAAERTKLDRDMAATRECIKRLSTSAGRGERRFIKPLPMAGFKYPLMSF